MEEIESRIGETERNQKRRNKKRWLLLLLAFIFLSGGVYAMVRHITDSNNNGTLVAGPAVEGSLTMGNGELLEALQRKADANRVTVQLNGNPIFADGQSKGTLLLGNPEVNLFDMHVLITDASSGIILYDSGLIAPGFVITEDRLKEELPAGDHLAMARIVYLDENQEVVSTTSFEITITVEA